MEEPSLEVVLKALDALFRKEDTQDKEQASLWLTQLQSSVHAWKVADQLLLLQRDIETSYFAAQTMQSKVRFHFPELPPDTHVSLRDSLMNHLQNLKDAPAPITRQLALALADLALQMQSWTSVVTDLIGQFSGDMATIPALLDVLIVLPEEINNKSLHLGQNRRKELRKLLGSGCLTVLQLLVACLSSCSHNFEILTRVYACVGSWVQLGNFPCEELAQSPLITAPFQTLQLLEVPNKLYEAATDCICSALYTCEDTPDYYPLATALQVQVKNLLPVYQAAVLAEDSNRAFCLCRIFTEMAESFLYHIVNRPNADLGDLAILDMILECVGNHDYEVAEITFNVWYRLSEELTKMNDSQLTEIFQPYIHKLVSHLCVHCQLDEDASPTAVPDKNDDFSEFRDQVIELLRDVVFMVGALPFFSELYKTICTPGTAWNVTEACLFVMQAIAGFIPLDESSVLPIAIPVLLSISPDTHLAIRSITLKLVAQLSEWINKHPDTLDQVLKFILDGLHIPSVASDAAKAVQSVCQKCKGRMAPHFEGLLQIIHAAESLSISNEAVIGLLKGATEVLTKMPHDHITAGVRTLCSLQTLPLSLLLGDQAATPISGSQVDPCVWVDRLTAVFRSCVLDIEAGQKHPCTSVLEEVWPVISALCYKYKEDQRVVERICRCLRFMLRSTSTSASVIVAPLVSMSIDIYRSHHHSCFLYLGSIVADEFGPDPSYHQGLIGMLQAFAEVSLPLLAEPSGLINHPDTVDDLYRLSARFLQRCPTVLLSSAVSLTLIQCALAACTLSHRDGFTSVMKFFRDLICLPSQRDLSYEEHQARITVVQEFLDQNGQLLVDGLVSGFVSLPTFMTAESSEVLWALIEFNRETVKVYLDSALKKLPVTTHVHVTDEQKSNFVSSVLNCVQLDDIYPIVKDLARLYR